MLKYILTMIIVAFVSLTVSTRGYSQESAAEYTVGIDDVISISVLQPDKLATTATVSPDGSISFPYIGNVQVKGLSLTQVTEEIKKRLSDGYMKYPVVSVALIESRSRKFFVYGEVFKPGVYHIDDNVTVLRAISMAGGFTKFGSSNRVKVLRLKGDTLRYTSIKVNMTGIMKGTSDEDILIKAGDIIVVSEGVF